MKIAFVYDAIYPYVKGGGEKRTYDLSRRLSSMGHEVHLIGMKYWGGPEVIHDSGVHLHGVCEAKSMYTSSGRRSIWQAAYFSYKLLMPLLRERFDVVECGVFPYLHCFPARIACTLKRKPLVLIWYEVWGGYWREYLGLLGFVGMAIEKLTAVLTKNNIALSGRTQKNLVELGVPEENITVVPVGLDLDSMRGVSPSKEKFDVIFAGRLIPEKNVDVLIKAIKDVKKKIPGVRCCVIGKGPEAERLKGLVRKLRLEDNLTFRGFLKYEEVIAHMKSSKVFVLPSTREGFGIVVIEANACGLPVITVKHRLNASADLIDDGKNGFVCELSEEELSEKIITILKDDDSRAEMSRYATGYSKNYGLDRIVGSLEAYYKNLCNTGK